MRDPTGQKTPAIGPHDPRSIGSGDNTQGAIRNPAQSVIRPIYLYFISYLAVLLFDHGRVFFCICSVDIPSSAKIGINITG